jgi:hypothetical protein
VSRPQSPAGVLVAAGYLIYAVAGVLCAAYEVLLVPTRWGSHLLPIAPVLAIGSNIGLPLLSRQLTGTVRSALPPVVGWLLAAFVLASTRPEGDVLLPAGDTAWVSYGVLFGGALAGLATLVLVGRGRPPAGRASAPPADRIDPKPEPARSAAEGSASPGQAGRKRPLPRPRHGPARSGSGSGDAR